MVLIVIPAGLRADLPTAMPSQSRPRLNSWKEVAEYLQRDLSTVIRWEKDKGLPVHRVPGGKRQAVFAYTDEIEAWLARSDVGLATPSSPQVEASNAQLEPALSQIPPSNPGWPRIRAVVSFLAAFLLLTLAATLAVKWKWKPHRVVKAVWRNGEIKALDEVGHEVWSHKLPRAPSAVRSHVVSRDQVRGANDEVLVLTSFPDEADPSHFVANELYCFSSQGKLAWRFAMTDLMTFGNTRFEPPWEFQTWLVFPGRGGYSLALAMRHNTWWPSVVFVLDAQGRVKSKFVNSGWVYDLAFLETPSRELLLAGGISNANNAGMLAVWDARTVTGTSPEQAGSPYECLGCPSGRPLHYFVFPRSELNVLTGSRYNYASIRRTTQGAVTVHTLETGGEPETMEGFTMEPGVPATLGITHAIYEFSVRFELQRTYYADPYWDLHRKLELEGKIKHSKARCPDRDGPRMIRSWDPQHGWKDVRPAS